MWLSITSGEGKGLAVQIEGERFLVGSSRDCRLVIRDDDVAAIHAFFEVRDDGTIYVNDLATESGTFVRGSRIDAPARLDDGDEVRFGGTTLVASYDDPAHTPGVDEPAVEVTVPADPAPPQPDEEAVALVTAPEGSTFEVVPGRQRRKLRERVRLATGLAVAAAAVAAVALIAVLVLGDDEKSVEDVVAQVTPSTVIVKSGGGSGGGTGSGFVLDADEGLIVTNFHVINGGASFDVLGQDVSSAAEVVGAAPCDDLAVLKVKDNDGLEALPLASQDDVKQGESVVAVGYPANASNEDKLTSTAGVVSVVRSSFQFEAPDSPKYPNVVQTDAALSPGNSGGPLVDRRGRLVGVNTAILTAVGDAPIQGQGYAIGVDRVKEVVAGLREGRSPGWAGFGFGFVDDAGAEEQGLPRKGIPISPALPGTPAEAAKIPPDGALLMAVGDRVLEGTINDYCEAVGKFEPGDDVPITLINKPGKKPRTVPVKMG